MSCKCLIGDKKTLLAMELQLRSCVPDALDLSLDEASVQTDMKTSGLRVVLMHSIREKEHAASMLHALVPDPHMAPN